MLSTVRIARAYGLAALLICTLGLSPLEAAGRSGEPRQPDKLDAVLRNRAERTTGTSRVIVVMRQGAAQEDGRRFGARVRRRLALIGGSVMDLPNAMLRQLAADGDVVSIHEDRPVRLHLAGAAAASRGRAAGRGTE
jgi:hypothetical protein